MPQRDLPNTVTLRVPTLYISMCHVQVLNYMFILCQWLLSWRLELYSCMLILILRQLDIEIVRNMSQPLLHLYNLRFDHCQMSQLQPWLPLPQLIMRLHLSRPTLQHIPQRYQPVCCLSILLHQLLYLGQYLRGLRFRISALWKLVHPDQCMQPWLLRR